LSWERWPGETPVAIAAILRRKNCHPQRPHSMKAVILAGGLGTRISEETHLKPKPMIEIGGRPILWHILKLYSAHGVNDFVICCGYKGYVIKEYFANYFLHMSDVTFDMSTNAMEVHQRNAEPWRVTLVDTGDHTLTGGRLKRVAPYVQDEEAFCFTYGDGLSDVDIAASIRFHQQHGRWATVTAVQPPGRYGAIERQGDQVSRFVEKPRGDGGLINGGFFVLSPQVLPMIAGDDVSWEGEPLSRLAQMQHMMAYEHHGFWQPMDTLRDKTLLEELWHSGKAPWKIWA
jgi:glucose-1-phosphate cytidylyltransferase